MASVINEAGDSSLSHSLPSKSTVHRCRQNLRKEAAQHIKESYEATTSVVHWDGKLIPDVTGSAFLIDRLPVLVTCSRSALDHPAGPKSPSLSNFERTGTNFRVISQS